MTYRTDVRGRLLQAAEDLVRAKGLPSATVEAVAERAGVPIDEAQTAFPDQAALKFALAERYREANADIFLFALREIGSVDDAVRMLQKAFQGYFDVFIGSCPTAWCRCPACPDEGVAG